jgi:hypothetical protein
MKIFNLIILDESGSMHSIKNATLSGFNEVFETIRQAETSNENQVHFVSFFSFNTDGIKTQLFNQPASMLKALTADQYQPRNGTPLYDAMGFALSKQRDSLDGYQDAAVLVTILTDGEENASREYSGMAITALIDELKKLGWTITYIGANHDVYAFSKKHGIDNAMSYRANEKDMRKAFAQERHSRVMFYMAPEKKTGKDFFKDASEAEKEGKDPKK